MWSSWFFPTVPQKARWLSNDEKAALQALLDEEAARSDQPQTHRLVDALRSGRVWLLALLYFLMNVGSYGYEMWLPSIIKGFSGASDTVVGCINAIPYIVAVVVMLLVGHHSDRTGERRYHVAVAAMASALGFALSAYFKNPYLALAALALSLRGDQVNPWPILGSGNSLT